MARLRGPRCTICNHQEGWRIELLRAGGASLDSLAKKFSVSRDAIHRHWTQHVSNDAKGSYLAGPAQMERLAQRAAEESDSVVDYLRIVRTALMASLTACSEAGDARGVALVAGQLIATLEKLGKISGEIATIASSVNVNVAILQHPEFARAQAVLLSALAPYPDARIAVVAALRGLEHDRRDPPLISASRPTIEVLPPCPY